MQIFIESSRTRSSDPHNLSLRAKRRNPEKAKYWIASSQGLLAMTKLAASLRQRELQQQRALDHREIVIGNHGQHGVTLGRDVGVDAFHVVDLVAEVGFEDRRAVDGGAAIDGLQRDAPDADAD